MPERRPDRRAPRLRGSDVRGLARLGVEGVQGLTHVVEAMHLTIGKRPAPFGTPPQGRTSGITGLVYRSVRGTTGLIGAAADGLLRLLPAARADAPPSPQRDTFVAALNGLWGDHLADSGNPLAIPMTLHTETRAPLPLDAPPPAASGRLLVLVHGLCMSHHQWAREGHDHGVALARDLGYTPVYVSYNSGRHVSQNGQELAALLERLVAAWPVPIEAFALVGHSMGGLVTRSACHAAQEAGHAWLGALTRQVFLGTPHHGAVLERGGHWVDQFLGVSPYVLPLSKLGKVRSAGITDLRYGNVQEADWSQRDRHDQHHDDRRPTLLPAGVTSYAMAACLAEHTRGARARLLGDGLVPLPSALGEHEDPALALPLPATHRRVLTTANHFDLLSHPEAYATLQRWLAP